jgi:D-alanyl-D-alanine carboxypeptidase/D-alanyl-D-alanine-endopeptidase (penicillin-binding protein 4)
MKTGKPGSGDNGYIYAAPGQYTAMLRGTIPADGKPFAIKGALPDPALFCAQYFKKALEEMRVNVTGQPLCRSKEKNYDSLTLVWEIKSPSLRKIVLMINKRSVNLYMEQLLYHLALAVGKEATTSNGIAVLMDFLDKNHIPANGIALYDGCGLSRTNRITALSMVRLLQFAADQPWYRAFYNSLAVGGDPEDIGFFKRFGNGSLIANNVRIKSGLIAGVRSLSGYLKSRSGKMIAFSFIVNNHDGSSRQIDRMFEKILIRAAEEY